MEGKIKREVSMRLCLVGSWMISEEGPCPGLGEAHSSTGVKHVCVTEAKV